MAPIRHEKKIDSTLLERVGRHRAAHPSSRRQGRPVTKIVPGVASFAFDKRPTHFPVIQLPPAPAINLPPVQDFIVYTERDIVEKLLPSWSYWRFSICNLTFTDARVPEHSTFLTSRQVVEANLDKYECYFPSDHQDFPVIKISYPAIGRTEEFMLAQPLDDHNYHPIEDLVASITVSCERLDMLGDSTRAQRKCLLNDIYAAQENRDLEKFKSSVEAISLIFAGIQKLPESTSATYDRILEETYGRCARPYLKALRSYKPFSDNVYGELTGEVIADMAAVAGLRETSRFVDLGSGTGNVVMQMSLTTGCRSFGIEVMNGPSKVASQSLQELTERAKLHGVLHVGPMAVIQEDIFSSERLLEELQEADMVLVNNKVFQSQTNVAIAALLAGNLKVGALVFSVEDISRFAIGNFLLEKEIRLVQPGGFSWTNKPGKYFVHEKVNNDPHHGPRRSTRKRSCRKI